MVYVLSKEQSADKLEELRKSVSCLKCEDLAVAVVSDRIAFLPSFASRLSSLNEIHTASAIAGTGPK